MKSKAPVFPGRRFGRLVVIEKDTARTNKHDTYWLCQCDCGKKKSVTNGHLNAGTVKSCGCLKIEKSKEHIKKAINLQTKHGKAGTSLYYMWNCMRQRCENPNVPGFRWYGAKGVKVCEEWKNFERFEEWAYANGYKDQTCVEYAQKLSIDRIDSNGDYCPENCRWIPMKENTDRARKERWENAKRSNANRVAGTNVAL